MIQCHCQCLMKLFRYLDTFNKFKVTQIRQLLFKYYLCFIYNIQINATIAISHQQGVTKTMVLYTMRATHLDSNVQLKLAHIVYKMTSKGQLFQEKEPH